ncbi:hypothetical protein DFJ73DRAFT_114718 [Zopfochytrium polystomum]|nr:hypothetical protein DFJ73DRAFT_114718 [Zopfochytrium polystomum]
MPASSMSSSIASRAPRDQASANSLDGSSNNAKKISSATQPAVTTTPRTQQPSSAGSPSISTSTDPAIPVSSSSIPLSSTSTSTPLAPAAVSWAALARQALAQTPEPSSSLHPHVISDHADQSIQEIRQGKSTDRSSAIVAEELADRESLDGGSETLSVSVESTVASADVNGRRLETAESGSSSQTAPPGSDAGSSASQTSAPADAVASNHPTNVWKIRMSQQKQQQPQPQQPLAGTNQGESTMESRTPREPVSPGRHPTRRRPNNNNNNSKSGQSHDSVKSGAHNSSSASASLVDEDGFVKVQRKKSAIQWVQPPLFLWKYHSTKKEADCN